MSVLFNNMLACFRVFQVWLLMDINIPINNFLIQFHNVWNFWLLLLRVVNNWFSFHKLFVISKSEFRILTNILRYTNNLRAFLQKVIWIISSEWACLVSWTWYLVRWYFLLMRYFFYRWNWFGSFWIFILLFFKTLICYDLRAGITRRFLVLNEVSNFHILSRTRFSSLTL